MMGAMAFLSRMLTTNVALRFISQAAVSSEKAVALTRLILCCLMVPSTLLFQSKAGPWRGQPEIWLAMSGYALGIGFSLWTLATLRAQKSALLLRLRLSVVVDFLILSLVMIPLHLRPPAGYEGFLRTPDAGVLVLATVATGLRMSRSVAVLGAGLMLTLQGATIAIDMMRSSTHITFGIEHLFNWAVYSLGAAILAYAVAVWSRKLVYRAAQAERQAESLRQSYDLVLSSQDAKDTPLNPTIVLDGQRKTVGLVVCTLKGLHGRTGDWPAGRLIAEINSYFDAMATIIKGHSGLIDKFFGETMVAVFGLPKTRPDDAVRAVRAGLAMQIALSEMNESRKRVDAPELVHVVAVHYGNAAVGSIGSRGRRQYTVAGEVLAAAHELSVRAPSLGAPLIVSAVAFNAAKAVDGSVSLVAVRRTNAMDDSGTVYSLPQLAI